jgi:hypothetical protein
MKVKLVNIAVSILIAIAAWVISIPYFVFPPWWALVQITVPNPLHIFAPIVPLLYILAVILFIAAFQREKAKP